MLKSNVSDHYTFNKNILALPCAYHFFYLYTNAQKHSFKVLVLLLVSVHPMPAVKLLPVAQEINDGLQHWPM